MRAPARSFLAFGFAVLAGAGCDALSRPLDMSSPPPPPKCAETTDASGQTCQTCWDAMTGNVISNACVQGSNGSAGARDGGGAPPPPTGSGGSDGGGMCIQIPDGVESSCKPYDIWKQYGADRCAQQNLQLTDLALGPSCGAMSFQSVVYTCCAGTSPPLPPPKCAQTTDANGQICETCWDSATGAMISNDCVPGPTGGGGSGGADGGMCTQISDGGPSSCKPIDTWKQYGTATCAQQNLQLADITLGLECAPGSYQSVVYTCCAGTSAPPPPPKCGQTTDASGQICKTCWDQYGMIVSNDCADAGSPAPM